jgi:hypothetical protein
MAENRMSWHAETIPPEVAETAKRLADLEILRDFYLAGGTALALHLGHRRSVDLDFFSAEPFDENTLIANLGNLPQISVLSTSPHTVYLHVSSTKVSFIGYDYPLLFPLARFQGLHVADVRDIACMKLSALASRGSRRDFVDLYVVAREYGIPQLLGLFQQKFIKTNFSVLHLHKSLTYFADAEKEPMPDMLQLLAWKDVKEFFLREVRKLHSS